MEKFPHLQLSRGAGWRPNPSRFQFNGNSSRQIEVRHINLY